MKILQDPIGSCSFRHLPTGFDGIRLQDPSSCGAEPSRKRQKTVYFRH